MSENKWAKKHPALIADVQRAAAAQKQALAAIRAQATLDLHEAVRAATAAGAAWSFVQCMEGGDDIVVGSSKGILLLKVDVGIWEVPFARFEVRDLSREFGGPSRTSGSADSPEEAVQWAQNFCKHGAPAAR